MSWYVASGDQQRGPFTDDELRLEIQRGTITPDDLLWKPGLADWTAASALPGIYAPPRLPQQVLEQLSERDADTRQSESPPLVANQPQRKQIKCPWCSQLVASDAKICRHCRRPLSSEAVSLAQLPPPAPQAPLASSHSRTEPSFIARLWAGDLGLARTYWVYGWPPCLLFAKLTEFSAARHPLTAIALLIVGASYTIAIGIAIFRAADKYRGSRSWASLARVAVVFSYIGAIASLSSLLLAFIKPADSATAVTTSIPAASVSSSSRMPAANVASDSAPTLPAFLVTVATEANKTLPNMIDADTRLTDVAAVDTTLVYNYRLVKLTASDKLSNEIVSVLRPKVVKSACTTEAVRQGLLERGATLRYSYSDKHSKPVAAFVVTKADC